MLHSVRIQPRYDYIFHTLTTQSRIRVVRDQLRQPANATGVMIQGLGRSR